MKIEEITTWAKEFICDNQGKVRDLYHLPATIEGGQSSLPCHRALAV